MKVNFNWVRDQFDRAKVRVNVGTRVLELLKVWDGNKLSDSDAKTAVEIFSKVALGHSLVVDKTGNWVQAMPGFIKVGDQVRVRHDAYTGELGAMHNGRSGVVIAIRSGDIIVKTTDDFEPQLDGAHYNPKQLEKLVN